MDNEPILTIDTDGTKRCRLPNGVYHRIDGPAFERASGHKEWWLNDQIHRVDGPAIEYSNGDKRWYLNDNYYTFDDWLKANKYISEEEKLMLKLTYG
jgi:hypothetical protein